MDGWMDLLVGTGVSTALENVQWPKPFLILNEKYFVDQCLHDIRQSRFPASKFYWPFGLFF